MTTKRKELQAQLTALNETFQLDEIRLSGQVERRQSAYASAVQRLRERRIAHMKQAAELQRQINELVNEEIVT